LLAKSRRQRVPLITTGFGGKADVKGVKADMPLNTCRNRRVAGKTRYFGFLSMDRAAAQKRTVLGC
jgi:hypothetical protein